MSNKSPVNHEAWARNAVAFIPEKGLEREFQEWCGGWPCPVGHEKKPTGAQEGGGQ